MDDGVERERSASKRLCPSSPPPATGADPNSFRFATTPAATARGPLRGWVPLAATLFREKGFDGTTIRDIAHAVGMRSGSLFYHFANKQELLMAVMEESGRTSRGDMSENGEPRSDGCR
jgi:hypothetical protein